MKARKLEAIDTLRGLAALQVIAFHLACMPALLLPTPSSARPWIEHGNSGVTLFFLISAFTLCLSWSARAGEKHPYFAFCIRRIFRIVPLFLFWFAWMLWRFRHTLPLHWPEVVANFTFTYNFFPSTCEGFVWASWTLGVEMVFYALFPLIFAACPTLKRALGFFAFTVALSFLARELITHSSLTPPIASSYYFYSLLRHLPSFATGMICYHVYGRYLRGQALHSGWAWGAWIIALAVYTWRVDGSFSPTVEVLLEDLVYALLTAGLVVLPVPWVVNRLTRFFGEISYSIYLAHVPVISLCLAAFASIYGLSAPVWLKFSLAYGLAACASTVVAVFTYRLVEVPGMAVGKRFLGILVPVGPLRPTATSSAPDA